MGQDVGNQQVGQEASEKIEIDAVIAAKAGSTFA